MTVSTHVLDAVAGRPAVGVSVDLAALDASGSWRPAEAGVTDGDGRIRFAAQTPAGAYRLTFATGRYFAGRALATFYPEVTITFAVEGDPPGHFHVPLLLSPYAYSTYRGS
jgi:5-hydroxyisourate hydrolase